MNKFKFFILFLCILLPYSVFGAISFDSHSEVGDVSASSRTWSHTNSGNFLVVYGWARPSAIPSSITYNGDNLTLIASTDNYLNSDVAYMYSLENPDQGTYDIVVTLSASNLSGWQAVSYSGVDLVEVQPLNFSTDRGGSGKNNYDLVATTTVANSWVVVGQREFDSAGCVVTSGGTLRGNDDVSFYDSNAPVVSIGNHTFDFSSCGDRVGSIIWTSFSPNLEEEVVYGTSTSPIQAETFGTIIFVISVAFTVYVILFLIKYLIRKK